MPVVAIFGIHTLKETWVSHLNLGLPSQSLPELESLTFQQFQVFGDSKENCVFEMRCNDVSVTPHHQKQPGLPQSRLGMGMNLENEGSSQFMVPEVTQTTNKFKLQSS